MRLGITGNWCKPQVIDELPTLLRWLAEQGIAFVAADSLARRMALDGLKIDTARVADLPRNCDMILVFGGDGTVLSTARLIKDAGTPMLGVKMGGLGFLTEVSFRGIRRCIREILRGHFDIRDRMLLEFEANSGAQGVAVNDVVLDKGAYTRLIRINTFVDDHSLSNCLCDGVVVATPTGSTAYSLSVGGPILDPFMDAIVIASISPHNLNARPLVLPAESTIRIEMQTDRTPSAHLSADGYSVCDVELNQQVIIRRAPYKLRWVRYQQKHFADILRAKLNWGEDPRTEV